MTAGYADMDEVFRQVGVDPNDTDPVEVAKEAHLRDLDDVLTTAFDGKVERTWRGAATATERMVTAYGSDLLVLPVPVRSVGAVKVDGTWDGTTFANPYTLPTADYRLTHQDISGNAYGISRVNGGWWSGTVLVTAVWADSDATIPLDVKRALTLLVIGTYRQETYNVRDGEQGFDPTDTIPAPSPWNFTEVKAAIERYALKALVV